MDIHNFKGQFERILTRIEESAILPENKVLLFDFKDYLTSENIGFAKITRYLGDLFKFDKMLGKSFKDATEEDIRHIIGLLNQQDYSEHTKRGFKLILKRFYAFLRGIKEKHVYPPEVKWITLTIGHKHRKLPEELLTEEEIMEIVRNCETIRDKGLIMTLAESGARISEIALMRIKHVSFEERGTRITIQGKTGMRKVLVIASTPYIQNWINLHPQNNDPDALLWHNSRYDKEPLCYVRIAMVLKKAAKKAGIKKRVHPHLLRHSRATQLASIMSEASMKQYFGWAQGSGMAAVYVHMNGKEMDEAIMRANGVEMKKERVTSAIQPRKCLRCNIINEITNRCCKHCGLVLDEEYAKEVLKQDNERTQADEIMNKLVQDPEILELIKKKLNV